MIGPRSITFRLSGLLVLATSLVLVAIALQMRMAVDHHFAEQDYQEIVGKVDLVRGLLDKARSTDDLAKLPDHLHDAFVGHERLVVLLVDDSGRTIYGKGFVPSAIVQPAAKLPWSITGAQQLFTWRVRDDGYRGAALRLRLAGSPKVTFLAIGVQANHHLDFMSGLDRSLLLSVLGGSAIIALLSWWAVKRGLIPLKQLTQLSHRISASRLRERLSLEDTPAELRELAASFNAMLERLDDSFGRLADFSSDIAHELRTPISNMMVQTQVALSKVRDSDAYREVLHSNLEEYERLARMVTDMLFLAKADNKLITPRKETVDLAEEVSKLSEFFQSLAEEKDVTIHQQGQAIVQGDRLMLRRAICNLLANAIRHTPIGERVTVDVAASIDGCVTLTVANPGPPIPVEHLDRLFDRFYRIDPSRQHSTEGAGLGLAITKSIVEAHAGRVSVASGAQATVFTLILPPPLPIAES